MGKVAEELDSKSHPPVTNGGSLVSDTKIGLKGQWNGERRLAK
jgi:hypothetical protein